MEHWKLYAKKFYKIVHGRKVIRWIQFMQLRDKIFLAKISFQTNKTDEAETGQV
jgi:hypothetical protein